MKLLSIASGSSGNCIYVGSDTTNILIDAGISNKKIEEGLANAGTTGFSLDGICITHEHSDHVKGLGVLARKYDIPIYATEGTIEGIKSDVSLGNFPAGLFNVIKADQKFMIGDIELFPFTIYHDANEPVGYRFSTGDVNAAVATDCGHFDDYIIDHLRNLDAILIEANHDTHMLEVGRYPYYLKRRILSDSGHMSNESCGRLICRILDDRLKYVYLGHLSKENNYPALAYEAVRCEIAEDDCPYNPDDVNIIVARRDEPSEFIIIRH